MSDGTRPVFRRLIPVLCAALVAVATALPARADQANDEIVIVALGDSLTSGFMLFPEDAFPNQLEAALKARGHKVRVLNAGLSGDTAAGGFARLDWAVPEDADAVIVSLGANDALRGLDPAKTEAALDAIIAALKKKDVAILLAGMEAPRNLGKEYVERFGAIYPALAEKHDIALYPFFLDGVATDPKLNLRDGMHPNAKGIAVIVERILPAVEALIGRAAQPRG